MIRILYIISQVGWGLKPTDVPLPKKDVLSLEEIEEICKSFMKLGTRKIRLTGGEPTVRKDFFDILKNMKQNSNIPKITMTTNGYQLDKIAERLHETGLDGIRTGD